MAKVKFMQADRNGWTWNFDPERKGYVYHQKRGERPSDVDVYHVGISPDDCNQMRLTLNGEIVKDFPSCLDAMEFVTKDRRHLSGTVMAAARAEDGADW